jgi:hypothetical protein
VLRFDKYLYEHAPFESCVTVKEIVTTAEEAEREVERLNALVRDGSKTYSWQATRMSLRN